MLNLVKEAISNMNQNFFMITNERGCGADLISVSSFKWNTGK